MINYYENMGGEFIYQSDILNDVFDYAAPEKHDEFLEWAGKALSVRFVFDRDESMYRIERRIDET